MTDQPNESDRAQQPDGAPPQQPEQHQPEGAQPLPPQQYQTDGAQPPQYYQQPIMPQQGQPMPPQYGQPVQYQTKPPRSTAKFVWGIILTVVGGLIVLGQLGSIGAGTGHVRAGAYGDPVAAATSLILTIVLGLGGLAFGILLIATSRRRR